ncbi:uncharacterized protein LOC115136086 isoform X4 [Oncorhynchus nerka]|uniref:uncharacterized protein LOC115136086 isoform X4 n=1 Tax=Oncorhynchus nerka TaxID=8023 RepID=UPI001131DCAE|nr:uncharacterized protein LOC115136086 isoform X6 [Oncorhynchus nerka]
MLNTEALDSHSLNLRCEEIDTRCNGDINDSGSHNDTEDMSVLYSSVLHLAMLLSLHSGPSQAGLYLCWVNHSSLSHPITVNHTVMSNGVPVRWTFIVVSIGAVLILVVLIIMIIKCTHFKPVHTVSSMTENIIYSTLGDHHPITLSTAVPT